MRCLRILSVELLNELPAVVVDIRDGFPGVFVWCLVLPPDKVV